MHGLRLLLLFSFFSQTLFALDYTKKAEVKQFISMMHKDFNYKESYLQKIFKRVRKNPIASHKKSKPKIVKPLSEEYRPQGEWDIYARVHLENNQTDLGVEFMHKHRKTFQKAYEEYGVPP